MPASDFPNVLIFEEHGHLVVSVQASLNDDQWRALCRRVAARAHRTSGIVLDLYGLDVLDSFSVGVLQYLCKTLRFHGQETVISGIPLPVSLTLTIRGLQIGDAAVVRDLPEAINLLEHRPPYPPVSPGRHH